MVQALVRRTEGRETWTRLRDWDRGQAPAERLAALILQLEGFSSIDPSHPMGGRDGLKDVLCKRDEKKWIGAAYFPRGQQNFKTIEKKFKDDFEGVSSNQVDGIAFVTNQELTLGERDELTRLPDSTTEIDIFHLERISTILNRPICYGIRLDFLDIEMTKEEQMSFIIAAQERTNNLELDREVMLGLINTSETLTKQLNIYIENKSEIRQESNMKVVNAIPLTINRYPISGFLRSNTAQDVHKCSKCGFGFVFTLSRALIPLIPSTHVAVTCPKCNNADKIFVGI
jgi:hypothetical protein